MAIRPAHTLPRFRSHPTSLRPDSTRYARFIVRHPGWVLLFWVLVTLAAGSGLRLLEISNNHRAFFSPDNPQLLAFNALENTFNKNAP